VSGELSGRVSGYLFSPFALRIGAEIPLAVELPMNVISTSSGAGSVLEAPATDSAQRVRTPESEGARPAPELVQTSPSERWRGALERAQQGWAGMSPDLQQEFLEALEAAERRSRAPRAED
jgi:hypothetical protein